MEAGGGRVLSPNYMPKDGGYMRNTKRGRWGLAAALLALFALWTLAVSRVDVQSIGPQGSAVGFASLNAAVHRLTGVHMALYTLTDWLGLAPLCVALGFALLGLAQLVGRRYCPEYGVHSPSQASLYLAHIFCPLCSITSLARLR